VAIEVMKILSIIGKLQDLDQVSRLVVMNGSIHILNALSELDSNYLNLSASEEHIQALREMSDIRPYNARRDFSKEERMIKSFHDLFDFETDLNTAYIDSTYDFDGEMLKLKNGYDNAKDIFDRIEEHSSKIERLQHYLENLNSLRNIEVNIDKLQSLNFLKFRVLRFSNESFNKLKMNYENIPSVIFPVDKADKQVIVAAFTPEAVEEDSQRVFTSLNCKELELPEGYKGNAVEIAARIRQDIEAERSEINELKKSAVELKREYQQAVRKAYVMLELEKKSELIKSETAIGRSMFFMFGFVPESKIKEMRNTLKDTFGESIMTIDAKAGDNRSGYTVPTKIKNGFLVRPFETLVTMYGIPSYGEKDPTPFFAISYMLLFGAMFGDIGQGLVILLAGLFISIRTKNKSFGGILSRLGASSMIFGVLYGSIFGSEEIIPAILIRPMANINTMLLAAVAFGVILITIGYFLSFLNHFKSRDIEEGVFGKEGVAGFLFYSTLIFTILDKVTGIVNAPTAVLIGLMVLALLAIVFKQPLAGLVSGKKLYDESPADYYVEAGFGMIETLLSTVSSIISFIRVGAFALNHVGLYIAFATMAKMIGSGAGGLLVLIIGNIIIIGLEGLIVFIQSLRLEYYELFSKYYSGYGVEYTPVCLSHNE
jgi:V/A-type H+-transporting ATPase subunit I